MHESAIAQAVVRTVVAEAKKRRAKRVNAVELEVGALEGLGGRELRFAFELEAAGTPLEGAKLRVSKSAPSASCPACGKPRKAPLPRGHFHALPPLVCIVCGGPLRLKGGRGFRVLRAAMDV